MGYPRVHDCGAVMAAEGAGGDQLDAGEAAEVVRPGVTRPGETRYFRMPNGTVSSRSLSPGEEFGATIPAPPGGVEVDPVEGAAILEQQRATAAAARSDARALAALQRAEDYDALVALGLPAAAAARISGHSPPVDNPPAGHAPAG